MADEYTDAGGAITPRQKRLSDGETEIQWRNRITEARSDRKRFEPTWLSNLAFAAGKHWLQWDRTARRLVMPEELQERELFTDDLINEPRNAALGELQQDDDRPELLLAQEGAAAEQLQEQINNALAHGWDYDWKGDEQLLDMRRKVLDLGVCAIRCRFDPTAGPERIGDVPHQGGKPVLDPEKARALLQDGVRGDVSMKSIHEGQIKWDVLSPFNLLVPPGITHEKDFTYEIVVRPQPLDDVIEEYGSAANGMKEDGDIGSVLGVGAKEMQSEGQQGSDMPRLRGHVWVYTCYERPCRKYPKGRRVVLAGNDMRLLKIDEELPYKCPDGSYTSGISYFHWWRLNDRFWSRSFTESLKDPQRVANELATLSVEITKRGLPFVLVDKKQELPDRLGLPLEIIPIDGQTSGPPVINQGVGPGDWMFKMREMVRDSAAHASTLASLRLGENPENVQTYSQLALLNENEAAKRQHIFEEHKLKIAELVEHSVYDIRTYWGPDKQILIAGPDDTLNAATFNASEVPDFYVVRPAKGAARPRTQGAELKKIDDLWNAWVAAANPNMPPKPKWLQDSYDAGEALPLPDDPVSAQIQKASYENDLLTEGKDVPVAYYDEALTHIPIHREAQINAELSGDMDTWERIEKHIHEHESVAQGNAQDVTQSIGPPQPTGPDGQPLPPEPAPAEPAAPPMPPAPPPNQIANNLHIHPPAEPK